MTEEALLQLQMLNQHMVNIESGLKIVIYVLVAFFVWTTVKVLYKLFGGVFFGGV